MQSRRKTLKQSAAVAGLLAASGWNMPSAAAYEKAAFEAKSLIEALKALGAGTLVESKDVTIVGPDIAENGAVVPLSASTTLPGAKRLLLMVEKNPNALAALFNLSEAVEPNFSTRAKLGQSSDVYAVALTGDGKAYYAKKDVKVTLGGCGG